jgi:large subunit ribosomal protein L1
VQRSKRYRQGAEALKQDATYSFPEAIDVVQSFPKVKFDETMELAFNLGVDPKKSDQMVRGTVTLPNGTGKKPRIVVVTASEDKASAAVAAGAMEAGHQTVIDKISRGWFDFDVLAATPDVMRDLGKLGRILGPKGLMPSPKSGTVAEDVVRVVQEVQKGKIEFKVDRHANVHVPVGKKSFTKEMLLGNCEVVVTAVLRAKPHTAKGQYVRSMTLSSTMGPGVRLDVKGILAGTK